LNRFAAELEEDRHLDVPDHEAGRLLADGEDLAARGGDGGLGVGLHDVRVGRERVPCR